MLSDCSVKVLYKSALDNDRCVLIENVSVGLKIYTYKFAAMSVCLNACQCVGNCVCETIVLYAVHVKE